MSKTPLLSLPILEASQAQKHVTHNEALLILDAAIQMSVVTRNATAPPASPVEGARYLLGASPSGVWAGHGGKLAVWQPGGWIFSVPREGWRLWAEDDDKLFVFNGSAWNDIQAIDVLSNMSRLGVNTTADASNRLAVSSPGVLFSHAGSDQRLKINKQSAGDTGSLLLQTNFSGRAEIGLAGDDDFRVKVSADGSTWNEALVVNRVTGSVTLPNTPGGDTYVARSNLVSAVAGGLSRPNGTMTHADGLLYRWKTGAAELPSLPGLVPSGTRTLRHYGATGDGAANDKTAVSAALNSNLAVDGEDRTYGISGWCEPAPAQRLSLSNARLKQLTPDATTRTLHIVGVPSWHLSNVSVDMGGFITAGNTQDAAGIRINGGTGTISNVTIENGGPSSALAVLSATGVLIENSTVRGMAWNLTGIVDDVLQEFWVLNCQNVTVNNCRAEIVTATNNGLATVRYSRGFAISGTTNLVVTNCRADGVDQGFDTSGSGGNVRFSYTACHATNCGTWGFKFANTASNGQVTGCVAADCGNSGFVVSPWSTDLSPILNSQKIAFAACRAYRSGSNGVWSGFPCAGFRAVAVGASPGFPKDISFSNCQAIDDQAVATMTYGFYSDVTLSGGAAPGIAMDAVCSSVGHVTADVSGINRPRNTYDASGNHTFAGSLTTQQNLSVARLFSLERQPLTFVNGDNNNISGYYSYSRISGPTAAFAVTGFAAPAAQGALLILHNTTVQQMTIKHNSGSSSAGNRIRTMSATDLVLPAGTRHMVWLYYDAAENIWVVTGWTSTGGGGGSSSWGSITGTLSAQTDLQTALDAKAAAAHTHAQADVTNLVADLAGKAALAHTHAQADVTGLVADLAGKAPLASPPLTGVPTAPTAAPGTTTTQLATTAFVAASGAALTAWTAYVAVLGDGAGVTDFEATVANAGVTGASVIELRLAATGAADENEPEFTWATAMTARPASGSFALSLSFAERHSGPLNLQYRIN